MIGIVIPAHNEERYISQCLESVLLAVEHPSLKDQLVEILVVLDDCSDSTEAIVAAMGIQSIGVSFQNVGKTRAVGAEQLLKSGARWLAFTDADTVVPPEWLARQIEFDADAVCGTVEVDSWREYGEAVRTQYLALYQFIENHRHIHGANLGLSAEAYQNAGGFKHLMAHRMFNWLQTSRGLEHVLSGQLPILCSPVHAGTTSAEVDLEIIWLPLCLPIPTKVSSRP